jgi:hypothetical protein
MRTFLFRATQVLLVADDDDLERWVLHDFGTDRNQRPKGVVEVILRPRG